MCDVLVCFLLSCNVKRIGSDTNLMYWPQLSVNRLFAHKSSYVWSNADSLWETAIRTKWRENAQHNWCSVNQVMLLSNKNMERYPPLVTGSTRTLASKLLPLNSVSVRGEARTDFLLFLISCIYFIFFKLFANVCRWMLCVLFFHFSFFCRIFTGSAPLTVCLSNEMSDCDIITTWNKSILCRCNHLILLEYTQFPT